MPEAANSLPAQDPVAEVQSPDQPVKPGVKTSEFWVAVAAKAVALLYAILVALGIIHPASVEQVVAQVTPILSMALVSVGYSGSRGRAKSGAAVLLVVVFAASAQSACACSSAADRNAARCVVQKDVVDCTSAEVPELVAEFMPVVRALVAALTGQDGQVDWGGVARAVAGLGLRDGGCVLAALESEVAHPPPGAPPRAAGPGEGVADGLRAIRAGRWPGVRFRVPGPAGSVEEL